MAPSWILVAPIFSITAAGSNLLRIHAAMMIARTSGASGSYRNCFSMMSIAVAEISYLTREFDRLLGRNCRID